MSATLTWYHVANAAKTGTTVAAFFTDLKNAVDSKSGDANYKWQVASSSLAGTPYYVVLKRKDGSAGRILFVCWTSNPAGNNAAILEGIPTNNSLHVAYFPAGNVDTPSNLTAASGTIMGDDTGVIKCTTSATGITSFYGTSVAIHYADSQEAFAMMVQNPASLPSMLYLAGAILVDGSDNAYDAVLMAQTPSTFGSSSAAMMPWSTSDVSAGLGTTPCVRTNYGSADRLYYSAWLPGGSWASAAVSSTDILSDTTTNKVWFVPYQLLGQTKGEGFVLKLRQIAYGPGTTAAFTAYSTTGPVVQARQFNALTVGGNGYMWLTNFKL